MMGVMDYLGVALILANLLMVCLKRPENADWTYFGFWAFILLFVVKP